MKYRHYGATDLSVSEICFGTMRYAAQDTDDAQNVLGANALREAIDAGVNFIHSSFEYGTRWLTGDVLAKHPKRHELHHIIKVNVPDWAEPIFDRTVFRAQVEGALRELNVDRIAIVQHLHRGTLSRELGYCAEGEPKRMAEYEAVTAPLLEEFEQLRTEGKVAYLSTFPYTVGYARKAVESGHFSGVVAYFNALETEMLDLFPTMQAAGMGFLGIRPFAAGLLTDKRVDRAALPASDRMADAQFDRFYDQLAALKAALKETPMSWSQFAISFSLAHPVITSTIVGINRPEQLRTALEALDAGSLDAETLTVAHRVCTEFRRRFGVVANTAGVPTYQAG